MVRIIVAMSAMATLCMAGCTVAPPQEDPVLVKLADIEQRLIALERIIANGSLVELTVQGDALQRQVAVIQGRAETLEYNAEVTEGRQRELYLDLDNRVQDLESSVSEAAEGFAGGGGVVPGQLPVPGGTDQDNYRAAFELLKEQRYDAAALAFQQFLGSFPDSQLAGNAQYWLAESYYVTGLFEPALEHFRRVIEQYPRSGKIPDALLKIGYSNYELEHWSEARTALGQVRADYPDTTAARLAEQRLTRMDDESR